MVFEGIKHEHQRLKFHQGGCLDVILRNLPLVLVTPGPTPKKIYLKVNVFGPFKSWSCETFPTCLYREVVKPKNIYDIYEICYSIPLPFVCTSNSPCNKLQPDVSCFPGLVRAIRLHSFDAVPQVIWLKLQTIWYFKPPGSEFRKASDWESLRSSFMAVSEYQPAWISTFFPRDRFTVYSARAVNDSLAIAKLWCWYYTFCKLGQQQIYDRKKTIVTAEKYYYNI